MNFVLDEVCAAGMVLETNVVQILQVGLTRARANEDHPPRPPPREAMRESETENKCGAKVKAFRHVRN